MLSSLPQHASGPLNSPTSNTSLCNESSALAAPELQNLTPRDIGIIDAVIERAGSSATTFFTVFKAYSEVLKDHGLDPQEVVYYGKLLKLGTLRGKNWGEKWALVKGQHRPTSPTDEASQTESEFIRLPRAPRSQELNILPGPRQRKYVTSDVPKNSPDAKRRRSSQSDPTPKVGIFHSKDDFFSSTVVHKGMIKLPLSTATSEDGELSPVPPSYKSAIVEPTLPAVPLRTGRGRSPQADSLFSGKKLISVPKNRPKPAVDLDEAWKNIKMEQDEKYADEFRDNVLLARCWDIWRQGYLWIITTHQQIQEARDKLLLRIFMHKWRNRISTRRIAEDQRVARFSIRLLRRIFSVWKAKFKQKKQAAWREDMRQKMKIVKRKSELRIKRDTWTKWQRVLLLQRAQKHYEIGLLYRYLSKWQKKVVTLEFLEQRADIFSKEADFRVLHRLWHHWKFTTVLRHKYQIMTRRVESRIVADALDKWKTRMNQLLLGDIFCNGQLLKRAINRWKTAKVLKGNLESRANRYIARKDALLLRAIIRIWRARMRGIKLQRFKEISTLQNAWQKWHYRLSKEGAQKDVANNFLNRTNTRLLATTFQLWQQVLITHQNALVYAIKYDEVHLQSRMLLAWRMKLHDHLQMAKVARWANRYFVSRNALRVWISALEQRRRERKLRDFEIAKLRKAFSAWKSRTSQTQYLRQCAIVFREHIEKRVLRTVLTHWTNRVIEIKSRELDVAQQADAALLRAALFKWRSCRRRHAEEVSLLENYLLVKREDILRRAFYRWLTAKRAAEHRRTTHQRKEAQLRQILITSAWDKWRERFREERLRPLEYQLILDHHRHILRSAFKVWVGKTDSLPAVRFHSRNLKAKVFAIWNNALPNALKVKKARETDRHNTLARYFQKWARVYKTKTTLKAVERAKYLRLPASSSRQLPRPRPFYAGANIFPRRRSISSEIDDTQAEDNAITVTRRPLVMQSRSEKSASRSEYAPSVGRQPSPVRSIVSLPDRRSRSPSKPASVTENDRLWDAIRKAGQGRRRRHY